MKPALKSELLKLKTVRSTYVIIAFSFVLTALIAFWAKGIKSPNFVRNPNELTDTVTVITSVACTILAFAGTLLVTHEYRHNTIGYSLTAARNRTTVLFSKVLAISIFALVMITVCAVLGPVLNLLGWSLGGVQYTHQQLPILSLAWKVLFVGWAYSMYAVIIALIARNIVAAIVLLFLFPAPIEPLLTLIVKGNSPYLPFTALRAVLQQSSLMSSVRAAITVVVYITVGLFVAWRLFLKRDAN